MFYEGPYQEPSWQAELDALFPPGGRLSWLKIVWIAGDEWEPINRWVIYNMVPGDRANKLVQADLKGPNPRVRGHYDRVLRKFIPDPNCNIDRMQWELYQATHCYGRPYWIVQGSGGGHKRTFNRKESAISYLNGGPKQPPLIGDLPYATPDQRTWSKLAKLDLARHYSYLLDRVEQSQAMLDIHDKQIVEDMQTAVWGWLESQVQDVMRDEKAGARLLRETGVDRPFNEAAYENAFTE